MQLGFKVEGILKKYGWGPGAGTGWNTQKTVRELRFWHDQGFQVVEISTDLLSQTGPFFRVSDEEWRTTRAVVEESGVRFHSTLAWRRMICRQPWAEEKSADLLHIARVAEILGLRIIDIMVAPPLAVAPVEGKPRRPMIRSLWDATDRDFEVSATRLKDYARRIAGFGAAISLEIHEDSIHDCTPSALRLLKMIDEANVGVNPDTLDNGWVFPGEVVPDAVTQAKMVAPYVNHWHVKQYTRTLGPDGEWQRTGAHADEGTQPIYAYAQAFIAAGYDGAAIHECGRGADYAYNMRRFLDYMRWLLDEYVPNVPGA
ncbi:MAG: TIM barrel protein [Candidatus Latescibacteria bacterium]|nr:TIM barrel protein [Candidatus Latescibacterota bacterium]